MITDDELDALLEKNGMRTVAHQLNGGMMDVFLVHSGVNSIETFFEWVKMERASKIRQLARHELDIHVLDDDVYDFVLGKAAMLTEVHVNLKKVLGK